MINLLPVSNFEWMNPLTWWRITKENFYPLNNSMMLGQEGPVWISTQRPYEVYNCIPQLKMVIDRKALMFSNMKISLVNIKDQKPYAGKGAEEFYKLMERPNVMQKQNLWLENFKQQEQVYGNQFIYKNHPSALTMFPIQLWHISPRYIVPYQTGKIWDQVEMSGIIKYYRYEQPDMVQRDFKTDEILYTKLNDLDNPIIGLSPIVALQYPLSNIKGAYQYRNVIITQKGAIGILSNKSKDSSGAIPMKPQEKKRIQEEHLSTYGISPGQSRIILTEAGLSWDPMTYPTKDLMLFEEVDADLITIVDLYGLNINMLSNKKATFENVKNSIRQVYQDTIQPEADRFMQALGEFLKIPEGTKMTASYEHLKIMKNDKAEGADAFKSMVASLAEAVEAGLLDKALASEIIRNEIESLSSHS